MPLISVVIPIYNVSSYLAEGLDSVLNQEVRDIEVICVDDASTDDSLEILKRYAEKDDRIKVLSNSHNHGVGYSRNYGLSFATGEYVHFFDPDDLLFSNTYSEMLHCDSDVVVADYETFPHQRVSRTQVSPKSHFTSLVYFSFLGERINSDGLLCYAWRCLFRRSLLVNNNIRFNEQIAMGEDTVFNMEAFLCAKSITVIPQQLYKYRINENGAARSVYKPKLEQSLQLQISEKKRICNKYRVDDFIPFTKDMSEDIVKRYIMMMFNNVRNNPQGEDFKEGVNRILNMPMIRDAMSVVGFRNIYSSWKEYVFYLCMKFRLSFLVVKFLNR